MYTLEYFEVLRDKIMYWYQGNSEYYMHFKIDEGTSGCPKVILDISK